jgi:hypothetical protein
VEKVRRLGVALAVSTVAFAGLCPLTSSAGAGRRHAIEQVAAALHKDGLKLEQPARLYAGVCPQLLPRRRSDGYTILVSSSRACDAALRGKKTLTHVRGRTWVFAARFDNIQLLYVLPGLRLTAKSQALVAFLEVFVVIDA